MNSFGRIGTGRAIRRSSRRRTTSGGQTNHDLADVEVTSTVHRHAGHHRAGDLVVLVGNVRCGGSVRDIGWTKTMLSTCLRATPMMDPDRHRSSMRRCRRDPAKTAITVSAAGTTVVAVDNEHDIVTELEVMRRGKIGRNRRTDRAVRRGGRRLPSIGHDDTARRQLGSTVAPSLGSAAIARSMVLRRDATICLPLTVQDRDVRARRFALLVSVPYGFSGVEVHRVGADSPVIIRRMPSDSWATAIGGIDGAERRGPSASSTVTI